MKRKYISLIFLFFILISCIDKNKNVRDKSSIDNNIKIEFSKKDTCLSIILYDCIKQFIYKYEWGLNLRLDNFDSTLFKNNYPFNDEIIISVFFFNIEEKKYFVIWMDYLYPDYQYNNDIDLSEYNYYYYRMHYIRYFDSIKDKRPEIWIDKLFPEINLDSIKSIPNLFEILPKNIILIDKKGNNGFGLYKPNKFNVEKAKKLKDNRNNFHALQHLIFRVFQVKEDSTHIFIKKADPHLASEIWNKDFVDYCIRSDKLK